MSRRAKLLALTLAMLGLLGVATAAQAGNQLFSASLIVEAFGRDGTPSYPSSYFNGVPIGAHCNTMVNRKNVCGSATLRQGAPLTGMGTAVTDGMGGFTLPASGLARNTSGSFGYYPYYPYSYTDADLKNQAGSFFAGGGPGSFSLPYKPYGYTVAKVAAKKGGKQFGGTMQLLGAVQGSAKFPLSTGVVTSTFDWRFDILGAAAMVSPGGMVTAGYTGTAIGFYSFTATGYTGSFKIKGTAFPWTTGTVTATATGRGYVASTQQRKGYDNRTAAGLGTIKLVTPLLTHWSPPGGFETVGIGILRIAFEKDSPEPTTIKVSKTASFDGRLVSGTISIKNRGRNPAFISAIVDTLEVHFPNSDDWFEVADVPVEVPGVIEVRETVDINYSFDLCNAGNFDGANAMRNVVAVTLANKPQKAQTDTVVTRSPSFEVQTPACVTHLGSVPNGTLIAVDEVTATAEAIGNIGDNSFSDLALSNGRLFGSFGFGGPPFTGDGRIFEIDPTGAIIGAPKETGFAAVPALDFSPDGTLYGVGAPDFIDFNYILFTFNPDSGKVKEIGRIGVDLVDSIVFTSDGRLLGVGFDDTRPSGDEAVLVKINPRTGRGRILGFPGFLFVAGLEEDRLGSALLGSFGGADPLSGGLVSIDSKTLESTFIGFTGFSPVSGLTRLPDLGTTVIGVVVDPDGAVVEGAIVTTAGNRSSVTQADGTFSISDVPPAQVSIVVRASATIGGESLDGLSNAVFPVPEGVTDVGVVTLRAAEESLLAVSADDDLLRVIDTETGATCASIPITTGGGVVSKALAMARNPMTDEHFVIVQLGTSRSLARLDIDTGIATVVGSPGTLSISGLAFDGSGVLFGVSGDGSTSPETLFTLSTADASPTLVVGLGNGNDGEAIEFNPTDGLLYHASGFSGGEILETIDLVTLAITPVPLSGTIYTEAFGMAHDARTGDFLVTDFDRTLNRVTTLGFVQEIGFVEGRLRGLTFSRAPAFGACASGP